MSDVFEVAAPKAAPPKPAPAAKPVVAKPKPESAPRQPPAQDVVKASDVVATAPVKTRKKRTPRVASEVDEHMLFMRLHGELSALTKKTRGRVLNALVKSLT